VSRHQAYLSDFKTNLNDIINELENINLNTTTTTPATATVTGLQQQAGQSNNNDLESKIIEQNKELIKTIKKLTSDKIELRNVITRLEEEVWNYRNKNKNELNTLSEHDKEKV
jgi:translation initiation factor 2B subunit (eIF-2B alpha/beta/delta family)